MTLNCLCIYIIFAYRHVQIKGLKEDCFMLYRSPTFICLNILNYIMLLYILICRMKVEINIYLSIYRHAYLHTNIYIDSNFILHTVDPHIILSRSLNQLDYSSGSIFTGTLIFVLIWYQFLSGLVRKTGLLKTGLMRQDCACILA